MQDVLFSLFILGAPSVSILLYFFYQGIGRKRVIVIQTTANILCSLCGLLAHHLYDGKAPEFIRLGSALISTIIITTANWFIMKMVMKEYGDKLGLAGTVAAVATVILQLVAASIWM